MIATAVANGFVKDAKSKIVSKRIGVLFGKKRTAPKACS